MVLVNSVHNLNLWSWYLSPVPLESDMICSPDEVKYHRRVELKDNNSSADMKKCFKELCIQFPEVFSTNKKDIGHTNLITMDIDTSDSLPSVKKPYTLPLKHYDWVQQEIESLERAGIITRSVSPWASPVIMVPKKSAPGEPLRRRMCISVLSMPYNLKWSRLIVKQRET